MSSSSNPCASRRKTVALGKNGAEINRPAKSLGQTLLLRPGELSTLNRLDMHPEIGKEGDLVHRSLDRIPRPTVDLNCVLEKSYAFFWFLLIL